MLTFNILSMLTFLEIETCENICSLTKHKLPSLPDSIIKLMHVQYLNLSHTLIDKFLNSIDSLINLESLLLRGCQNLQHLLNDVSKLVHLDHLNLREIRLSKLSYSVSSSSFVCKIMIVILMCWKSLRLRVSL